jgi:hypothetical protein
MEFKFKRQKLDLSSEVVFVEPARCEEMKLSQMLWS